VATWNSQSVDARVTVAGTEASYGFVGWLPNYNRTNGHSGGDLGVYHRFTGDYGHATGGLDYQIEFFLGGETFSTPVSLPAFRLLLYDLDGESTQSESIRVFLGDGLAGYRLGPTSGITASSNPGSWLFSGPQVNHGEDSPDGGVLLYFDDTSLVRFQSRTTTTTSASSTWGLFTGIDGNASLVGAGESSFGTYIAVPEARASGLLAALVLLRRRRSAPRRA
jgi:hypothetical protein